MMKKYNGTSLVEMLITLVIITVVLLLATTTLTTLIKVSNVSSGRAMARDETEFVTELIRRAIKNTNIDDIYIYNVSGRTYNEATDTVISGTVSGYDTPVGEGVSGTEIHYRPVGYDRWVCIGYFPVSAGADYGYIVKSSYIDNRNPENCFLSSDAQYQQNAMVLNSTEVFVKQFSFMKYLISTDNILVTVDVLMEPRVILLSGDRIVPQYFRQALVSTAKLTWE